tara:strand:+ start:51 stop:740 length:690 start_codon:yes stop_codon:yes gene_type:complete
METKKSFVLYADFAETAHKLGDADAGKLFKMILDHANGEDTTTDNLLLEIAFGPIKLQMDRDAAKWQKTREARSEAGKKGGRPSKQAEANKANASFVKQSKANKAVTVNVTETVTVNGTVTETKIEKPLPFKSEDQLRIEKLFGKRVATPMDKAELSAWASSKAIVADMTEREWVALEVYCAAPQDKTYRRKTLATLLNNLSGELDKAADWSHQHTTAQRKISVPTVWK